MKQIIKGIEIEFKRDGDVLSWEGTINGERFGATAKVPSWKTLKDPFYAFRKNAEDTIEKLCS